MSFCNSFVAKAVIKTILESIDSTFVNAMIAALYIELD